MLWGDSRLGKTQLARSFGKHNYFGGMFNLDEYEECAEYNVFDDLPGGLSSWFSYKHWLGGQTDFTCTDKYRHKRVIKGGKPTIYCSNVEPGVDGGVDGDWLSRNTICVHIVDPVAWITHDSRQ